MVLYIYFLYISICMFRSLKFVETVYEVDLLLWGM